MIVTDIEHLAEQMGGAAAGEALAKAVAFLHSAPLATLPNGRVEIDGQRVYAIVMSYTTEDVAGDLNLEAHRDYIDIQCVLAGREVIGWAHTGLLTVTEPYDAAKEAWFGTLPRAATTPLALIAGQAAVFFPTDGHRPKLAQAGPETIRKIVVKVAVGG